MLLPRLTYANVVSTAARFAVLGGGVVAVSGARTMARPIALGVRSGDVAGTNAPYVQPLACRKA